MKRVPLILIAVGMLSAAGILACSPSTTSVAAAPDRQDGARTIPLGSCYATFGGSGCKYVSDGANDPHGYDMGQLFREYKGGVSNVVLVRGDDIAAAVKATRWAFTAGLPADTPILPDSNERAVPRSLWLAAYLGSGSSSGAFLVHAMETRGPIVRLTYSRIRPPVGNDDVRQYFVWVPLGEAKAVTHTLELYDTDRKQVMLQRCVAVAAQQADTFRQVGPHLEKKR